MKIFTFFSLLALLTACNQPAKQVINTDKPQPTIYNTPKGDKIIFLDDYYRSFLSGIKAGCKNVDSLYNEKIQHPFMTGYFAKSEYSDLVKYQFVYAIKDTTDLRKYISAIKGGQATMEQIIIQGLADANSVLQNDSITIYVQPSNNYMQKITQKMGGITAVTAGSKQILLTVDTSVSTWREMLKYTIAHEFNHTYWTKMNYNKNTKFTLLDYLVFEGRADSYAHLIYPHIKCPWTNALMDNEKANLWGIIETEKDTTDQRLQMAIMFGSQSYPMWGGYSLGYSIVQTALKNHPELQPIEWASMDPQKILEMSDYK